MGIKIVKKATPVTRLACARGFYEFKKHVAFGVRGIPYVVMVGWN
jgi:hypothetical protein